MRDFSILLLRSKHIADNEKMKMQSMPELSSVCAMLPWQQQLGKEADTHSKKSTMPQREVKVHHPFLHVISKSSLLYFSSPTGIVVLAWDDNMK